MSYPQQGPYQAKPFGPEGEVGYPAEPEKKGHGCFFYGCITLIVLSVLALVAIGIIAYSAYSYLNGMVEQYTSTKPIELPTVNYTPEQHKELDDRWAAFQKALDDGETAEIVLTGDDINALISENPEIKGKVYVTVKDDEISGQISIPLDQLPLFGKGRFLNAKAVFDAKLEDGELEVHLKSGEVNGKVMPPDVAQQFQKQNLFENVNDPKMRAEIRKFESMQIKGDKVILKAKSKHKEKSGEAGKAEEPTPGKTKDESDKPKSDQPAPEKEEAKTKEAPTEKPADAPKDKIEAPKPEPVPKAA
jgi:hypothetical protein